MKVRIYKTSDRQAINPNSWSVVFKLPKALAENPYHRNMLWFGDILSNNDLSGYWGEFPKQPSAALKRRLGKSVKIEDAPEPIRNFAQRKERLWNEACNTGVWDKWNNNL